MNLFDNLPQRIFSVTEKATRDKLAKAVQTNPELLAKFEQAYREQALGADTGNLFDVSSKDFIKPAAENKTLEPIVNRIVQELTARTPVLHVLPDGTIRNEPPELPEITEKPVTNEDLNQIPLNIRPQLTGTLRKVDIGGKPSSMELMSLYQDYKKAHGKKKTALGNLIRQGMEILDLDECLYELMSLNPNNISNWLPKIAEAVQKQDFLKLPETRLAKAPLPLLQLTRLDYGMLNTTTLSIVDKWAMRVFHLDVTKDYFVKTGIFSSKFNFRNAKVTGEQEVRELGQYLICIQNQAVCMAGPLTQPSIVGAATTNEFAVREFIQDKEQNPCIYQGLPLHTEYRVFVDFDDQTVLGISPYWRGDVMTTRFNQGAEKSPHDYHDYVVYKAHEETLNRRYAENQDKVLDAVKTLLPNCRLTGQWSVDIMQNDDDFYLIDMAKADESALNDVVPKELLKHTHDPFLEQLPAVFRKSIDA